MTMEDAPKCSICSRNRLPNEQIETAHVRYVNDVCYTHKMCKKQKNAHKQCTM